MEAHYTTVELMDEMFEMLKQHHKEEITEYLENSAGDGRIVDRFDKPYIALDIDARREDIKKCDYLKEKIGYKKGRVCVMNPPFHKGLKFLNKAVEECDYVISILSANSVINIDYSKIWCDEIQLYKKYDFGTCKASIVIVACRKKREGEKYEYE